MELIPPLIMLLMISLSCWVSRLYDGLPKPDNRYDFNRDMCSAMILLFILEWGSFFDPIWHKLGVK